MEEKALALAKQNFVTACEAAKNVSLLQNAAAAFEAATVVVGLRNALTPEVVEAVFIPLMNTKIGFLTDKDPSKGATPYTAAVVRDAIIDAASFGLLPIGNQMNIISGRMYPTKEGYTALLKNMGVKYKIYVGAPKYDHNQEHAQMDFSIRYTMNAQLPDEKWEGYKSAVSVSVNKSRDGRITSSEDQLKGKAERRAKKQLYELLSGVELGEAADVQDAVYTEIVTPNTAAEAPDAESEKQKQRERIKQMKQAEEAAKAVEEAPVTVAEAEDNEQPMTAAGGYMYANAAEAAAAMANR